MTVWLGASEACLGSHRRLLAAAQVLSLDNDVAVLGSLDPLLDTMLARHDELRELRTPQGCLAQKARPDPTPTTPLTPPALPLPPHRSPRTAPFLSHPPARSVWPSPAPFVPPSYCVACGDQDAGYYLNTGVWGVRPSRYVWSRLRLTLQSGPPRPVE